VRRDRFDGSAKARFARRFFAPESAGLQRRASADIEDFSCKWQTAGELLEKTNASVAGSVDFG
jgi:hypothetical protein